MLHLSSFFVAVKIRNTVSFLAGHLFIMIILVYSDSLFLKMALCTTGNLTDFSNAGPEILYSPSTKSNASCGVIKRSLVLRLCEGHQN